MPNPKPKKSRVTPKKETSNQSHNHDEVPGPCALVGKAPAFNLVIVEAAQLEDLPVLIMRVENPNGSFVLTMQKEQVLQLIQDLQSGVNELPSSTLTVPKPEGLIIP